MAININTRPLFPIFKEIPAAIVSPLCRGKARCRRRDIRYDLPGELIQLRPARPPFALLFISLKVSIKFNSFIRPISPEFMVREVPYYNTVREYYVQRRLNTYCKKHRQPIRPFLL